MRRAAAAARAPEQRPRSAAPLRAKRRARRGRAAGGRARGAAASLLLRRLARLRLAYGGDAAARKLALLRPLERAALGRAREVERLHEILCFLRAYPDDPPVLARVERMLERFARRRDLRRHRADLADTGIAGTVIHFPFFAETARWLARRWPGRLAIEWGSFEKSEQLEALLPHLVPFAETAGLDEYDYGTRGWVRLLKGPRTSDAAFVIQRLAALAAGDPLRETLHDRLDMPVLLSPGPDTPSRTRAKWPVARLAYQARPLVRARPDLRIEARRAPLAVRAAPPAEGRRLIALALEAMVTRSRDLDVFAYGDPRDVRLVDFGDGLQFACIGCRPERRLLLEAVYGFLTLRNGVPVGYVLNSALYRSAELAYNVFESFRGAEAAAIYAQVLAMTRALFGADAFTIFPYQLGAGNHEAIESGAWWFYQKLGFRPRDPGARRLMRRELARMAARPTHRSSHATLERLAEHNVYLHLGRERGDVIGLLPVARAGIAVSRALARRFGADRERAVRECRREAAALLGVRATRRWSAGERLAWERWAPLVTILPGVARWSAEERHAAIAVIRAKGGVRESDFVRGFDAHPKLRHAVRDLVTKTRE
ncbi:MAG: hypothetical protein HZC42_10885 [Candidatus Eisenbacteria bacterium]|nr:hypothetical protein [Candidatus Eisenbacteria bacterium]